MELYQIVTSIVATTIFLLLFVFFVIVLVAYFNGRKKRFIQEKNIMQAKFNEELLTSQLEIQEHTFNHISEEIHDNVGQILSLAKIQLNILEKSEKIVNSGLLSDAKESVHKALNDLRDIAKSLSTDRVQIFSLQEMIGHELQRINRSGILTAVLNIEGNERFIEQQKKLIIFRIIQESLHNILKHAKATNIDLTLGFTDEKLKVTIADNGTGFELTQGEKPKGLGLQNMTNRATLLGGEARIESTIGKGTIITIISPYE